MQKKNEKGIALITLIVAILMILILSSVIIYNTTSHLKINNLNKMYNDIRLLNNKVFLYYSKNQTLPILANQYEFGKTDEQIEGILLGYDASSFYVIDLNLIDKNIQNSLNYGKDYYKANYNGSDIYVINKDTHQIFYALGIQMDSNVYYTIPEENENNKYVSNLSYDSFIANPPVIKDNLTPIKITNVSNGTFEVTTTFDENWYDYTFEEDLSKWPHAQGESNTELYMWVPRYAYNTTNNEMVFLKGKTNTPIDSTKNISGEQWVIPDAFENREKEKQTGLWLSLGDNVVRVNSKNDVITAVYELTGKNNLGGSANTTITGDEFSYYNPVIPVGFKTVQTEDASWRSTNGVQVDGWNDGLVIEDNIGNQFVWVPVDGQDVSYDTHYDTGTAASNFTPQSLPNNLNENTQVSNYGGFYIGRYEAGVPSNGTLDSTSGRDVTGTPVSKKNQIPWNDISWSNAKTNAENMKATNSYYQTVLVTEKMWDTTMQWLENSGVNVTTDCTGWGNYQNSPVENVIYYSINYGVSWSSNTNTNKTKGTTTSWLLKTGSTTYTKKNNIYDLAGNLWEWTNSKYSAYYSIRAGYCGGDGTNNNVATYRYPYNVRTAVT